MAEPEPEKEPASRGAETTSAPESALEPTKNSPLSGTRGWLLLAAVVIGVGLLVFASSKHLQDIGKVGEKLVQATKTTGKASIGGPFELTDHNGNTVTEKSFAGKYTLVYFGYTYCPDVCPTGLTEMSNTLDMLGADAEKIVPIFISVDPARDTPDQLREYASYFHPRLIGMTGTPEQVASVAKAYRVYFAKVESKDADADPDDYSVDHSAVTYLMDPNGEFTQHFSHGTDAETMAKRIKEILNP
jgi:cytochrome oxidase Cu insertion factor (SCO1/SenC/PrrC family)